MARRRAVELHSADVRRAPLVDPRDGDIEADASSTESRSLLAIAGNLLVEVSLPKFAIAVTMAIAWIVLRIGDKVVARMGETGIRVMTRIMGLLLAAIAMQFVISGASDAWHAAAS